MRVFDAHCDTIYQCYIKNTDLLKENPDGHWDLVRTKRFSAYAQFFAIFEDSRDKTISMIQEIFTKQYDIFQSELMRNQEEIMFCRTRNEAETAFVQGKVAAFLSVEGADLLGCSLEQLERAYFCGVRAVNLTWNRSNLLSGSAAEQTERGLSSAGKAFVKRMQELGMLVDVSHLSDPGFWDVIDLAKKPVIASHSNARAICHHPRNLTDAQFSALLQVEGVAGLNLYSEFLGSDPDFDTIRAHLDHFWALGGEDHLSIGGDWDGCDQLPKGMEQGIAGLLRLYEYLLKRNYSESILEKLYYKNLMRVVGEVCTISAHEIKAKN
jgi:membrane dipeptidase